MYKRNLLYTLFLVVLSLPAFGQYSSDSRYVAILDDARFEVGARFGVVFALDDKAPLSSNPHFRAMLNLIQLGASLEAILNGMEAPVNDIDQRKEYGKTGYNKTVFALYARYGFGESSDLKIQTHWLELAIGPGYFKEGNGGVNIHFDYQFNFLKTPYGAGIQSIQHTFDYEVFAGARIGFDWSSGRSENEAGFFTHLNNELDRIASEHEFSAAQLLKLQDLVDDSRILLPKDAGGRAFAFGPILGGRLSYRLMKRGRLYVEGMGFYDIMDLTGRKGEGNRRSQHHVALNLGFSYTIGSEGEVLDFF